MTENIFLKDKYICASPAETKQLGISLAKKLKGGETLLLFGNLGAGKTLFLQGLAKGLGVKDKVNSPTFNILKVYKTKNNKRIKEFCHIDAYRLNSGKDLEALGIEEIWSNKKTVVAIEWAEKIKDISPKNKIKIIIKTKTADKRQITIDKI